MAREPEKDMPMEEASEECYVAGMDHHTRDAGTTRKMQGNRFSSRASRRECSPGNNLILPL